MSIRNNTISLRNLLSEVNALPDAGSGEQATPEISVSSNGLITATAGTKSSTKQLTTQSAKTITPTKTSQTAVTEGKYTTGIITVAAIPDEYIMTTDATASAPDVLTGETAYVNGKKITGTMVNNGVIASTMDGINTKSISVPAGYTSGGTVGLDSTIDNEANEQSNLIDQIIAKANSLPNASSGGSQEITLQDITITNNGTYTADDGYDGFGTVSVNVAGGDSGTSNIDEQLVMRTITQYSNSNITSIGSYAFCLCTALTTVSLPNVTNITQNAFNGCHALASINIPKATQISGTYAFYNCSALQKLDLPSVTNIASKGIYNCTKLATIILRSPTVATLAHTDALTNSMIAKGTGYIYVPRTLVDSYKVATNWASYAAQFRAIEDYPDICG